MTINKRIGVALLAGTILCSSVNSVWAGDTWQTGGASTNRVSDGTAKVQQTWTYISSAFGLVTSVLSMISPYWALNFDVCGIVLDAVLLNDAKHRKGKLSEEIPELTAAVREIGDSEEKEGECEDDDTGECNELNAKQDKTQVHVATLQNVGLEALEDVAGSVLIEPEELSAASTATVIKEGFGTSTVETTVKVNGEETTQTRTLTEDERSKMDLRKLGHLQLTGTAGVARSDLGITVAKAEQNMFDSLWDYVGSGQSLIANIKVLCGLDLTLAQRLNLLNMLYGQEAANEAASALQLLQDK